MVEVVCCSECNVVSECDEPTSCLVHGGEVMYFGCVCFRGEFGFLNCDDICMCVVNKQFELLKFFIYILLMLTYSMMRFLSLLLMGLYHCGVSLVMWSSLVCL